MQKLSFFSPINTKTNLRTSKWQNVHFCNFSKITVQNPNLCDKSQTIPSKNRLYIILFIVVFYVVVVVDVLMFLDCVQISSCEFCGVWHCDCGDVPCLVSLRTHGQTLIRFSISLIIIVGWFSLFASSVLTEFSVIPDSRSALYRLTLVLPTKRRIS